MQEHPWLDRLYVKLALQVKKKKEDKKKVSNNRTQNGKKKRIKESWESQHQQPATVGGHADELQN